MATGSSLLLDETFESADPGFLTELLRFDGEQRVGAWAEKLLADKRPFARAALLSYIDDGCDREHHRALVKRLFKRAEAAGDDEVMAHFLVAFDRLSRRELREVSRWDWASRSSYPDFVLERVTPTGQSRFSTATRLYLRRRAWRYFRFLGWKDPTRYLRGLLVALPLYREEDLAKVENLLDAWGLMHALYHAAPALSFKQSGVRLRPGRTLAELAPAPFKPQVWKDRQAELFGLVSGAGSRTVRAWAIAWLRAHHELSGLPFAQVRALLGSPHEEVQLFAAELLKQAAGLEGLGIAEWLELLKLENPAALPLVCELVEKHVSPARLEIDDCVELARSPAAPVAELGLRWLREKKGVELPAVLSLGEAETPRVRAEAVDWLLERIRTTPTSRPEHLRELIDARHADTRERALAVMAGEERFRDAEALWAALPESPYDDVRTRLVAYLEQRLAALPPGSVRHVWVTALLAVHRGGKAKPQVAHQIAQRLIEKPSEAPELLPLLGIALRSLRQPEKRAALAAVVRAAETRPALRDQIKQKLPELVILDDAATAKASLAAREPA